MKEFDPTFSRIDSLVNLNMQYDFMRAFAMLLQDIQEDEPFEADDVIDYLEIKMRSCAQDLRAAPMAV